MKGFCNRCGSHLTFSEQRVGYCTQCDNVLRDDTDDWEDVENDIVGYECFACGNVQNKSGHCFRCTSNIVEPKYK